MLFSTNYKIIYIENILHILKQHTYIINNVSNITIISIEKIIEMHMYDTFVKNKLNITFLWITKFMYKYIS